MPRYAKKRDGNELQIKQALTGLYVYWWEAHTPMDLPCFDPMSKQFFWLEVKNPENRNPDKKDGSPGSKKSKRTKIQREFMAATKGGLRTVVETVDDVVTYVQQVVRKR